MPLSSVTADVNRSTGLSMPICSSGRSGAYFRLPGRIGTSSVVPQTASEQPASASERSASTTLSVSSWRTMRPRLAPIAQRIASSRERTAPRASIRFATLTQAMSSTKPTTASIAVSAGLRSSRPDSLSGLEPHRLPGVARAGFAAASARPMTSISLARSLARSRRASAGRWR